MAVNFIDALNAARRRAMLTGQAMTPQEKQGMNAGWFDAAAATANRRKAQEIAEKQAEDRLAQERWAIQEQMDAAKKAQTSELTGNIANTAVNTLGMDWLKSKPGESMISKGWQAGKESVGKAANWWGPGDGATTPTFTGALNAPAGTDLTGVGGFAPEGGLALTPEAYAGAGADLTGLAGGVPEGASTTGSLSTTLGSIATPLAIIGGAEFAKQKWGGNPIGWGGKNNDWDEKNFTEKATSAPVTMGTAAQFFPGALFGDKIGGKVIKEAAKVERMLMKPIDWVFGGK